MALKSISYIYNAPIPVTQSVFDVWRWDKIKFWKISPRFWVMVVILVNILVIFGPKKALFSCFFHEKPYNDVNVNIYFGHHTQKLPELWVNQSFFYVIRVKRNQHIEIWVGIGVMVAILVQPLAKLGVLIFGKSWIIWNYIEPYFDVYIWLSKVHSNFINSQLQLHR